MLGALDPQTGRYEPVAALPGFTRGLDFPGRFAFVGLSQVPESAVFSGIPITERPRRTSGLRRLGGRPGDRADGPFLRFEAAVQESSPSRCCRPALAGPDQR